MQQTWMIEPATGDLVAVTGGAARLHARDVGTWQWTTEHATGFAGDLFAAMLDAGIFQEVQNG